MTTRIILWRHGNTDWNAERRTQGQMDVPLNDRGRAQAAAAAPALARLAPDTIISSDLRRAADTAAALAELVKLPVSYDVRLRERHFGAWQGLTRDEIIARYPEEFAAWRAGHEVTSCGLETREAMRERIRAVVASAGGGTTVLVTHGGTAMQAYRVLLGWPQEITHSLGSLGNCHWSELRLDEARGWILYAHNASVTPALEPAESR